MPKNLTAKKEEGLAEIIDRALDEPGREILLVIPKGSVLGKSARNFHILKNEIEASGKKISVESSDEEILMFAKNAGIGMALPGERVNAVSDIIPARMPGEKEEKDAAKKQAGGRRKIVRLSVETSEEEGKDMKSSENVDRDVAEEEKQEESSFFSSAERFFKPRQIEAIEPESEDAPRRTNGKRWGIIVGAVIAIVIIVYAFTAVFSRADIVINFKKTPWQYQGSLTADKAAASIDAAHNILPAQVFTIPKNTTQLFPASANQNVSVRAQGTMAIYNAYSSAAQELVATTRFVTPDGKIFRLAQAVTVPGAQVTNGQIVPSSINATVVADKPGPDYNVGAVSKLAVPGFQGTPKYNGFYGTLANGTSGGFTGQKAVPTAADIAAAKGKMAAILQAGLQTGLANAYPSNFKILDGATNIAVTKLTVNTSTDQNGNFTVFGEATLRAIGFDEAAFRQYLLSLAQSAEPSSTFSSLVLNYSNVKADFTAGKLAFSLLAQGALEPAFSADDFKANIGGGSVSDARAAIASLPQLQDGSISVWPAWVWSIPGNPAKVNVTVN